jgi:hypothetical protein
MPRKKKPEVTLPVTTTELEHPWPSSPFRTPRYCLYCDHASGRRWIVSSYSRYAIRRTFDAIVGKVPFTVKGDTITTGDLQIFSYEMKEILQHKLTPAEQAWEFPPNMLRDANQLVTGMRRG